jgi:hypothetical protein
MDRAALYNQAIESRRRFRLSGYVTLAEAGFEGPWVSPIQISSGNLTGPMMITKDWFDAPSAIANAAILQKLGYMPGIPFNMVLDAALDLIGLQRSDIYITPVFKLLPPQRSHPIRPGEARASFDAVTRHELLGRKPIAAGTDAIRVMQHFGIPHVPSIHPSARGLDFGSRAKLLAKAFEQS